MKKYIFILLLPTIGCLNNPFYTSNNSDQVKIKIALPDLQEKDFVKLINMTKDTFFENARSRKISYVQWGGDLQYPFNRTKFHSYLLSHLPKAYAGDTSVNLRTTGLTISIIEYYSSPHWWHFQFSLWHNGEIIMSESDDWDISSGVIYKLPDMSKYGYK
jgi:hypothetical protein